jgi:hypothetical protein
LGKTGLRHSGMQVSSSTTTTTVQADKYAQQLGHKNYTCDNG